jgi:hypothetical protein
VKPYRVWCRDRLQRALVALDAKERGAVEQALGVPAVARLAQVSPRAAEDVIGTLPIAPDAQRTPVDSWWRPRG